MTQSSTSFTVTSSNPALIPDPTVANGGISYNFPNTTGTISLQPGTKRLRPGDDHRHSGQPRRHRQRRPGVESPAKLHRERRHGQPAAHARSDHEPQQPQQPQQFHVQRERRLRQTVNLTGISTGNPGTQFLTVTHGRHDHERYVGTHRPHARTTRPTTRPVRSPSRRWPTPAARPMVTVTVENNGGTVGGGSETVQRSFTVTVLPVNQPPTLGSITAPPHDPREQQPHAGDDQPDGHRRRPGQHRADLDRQRHEQRTGGGLHHLVHLPIHRPGDRHHRPDEGLVHVRSLPL